MKSQNVRVRLVNIIFVSQSLFSASEIAIFTLLSILAVNLSGRESFAGIPSTALMLSQSVMALPIGIIMGRLGRRFGLGISYSASASGAVLGAVAVVNGWFWLLVLSSLSMGLGKAGAEQARFAAGDMFPDVDRGRMIGRVVFAGTIGAIFGPLLVGPGTQFAGAIGINPNTGPYLFAIGLYLVATLVIFALLYPEPNTLAIDYDGEKPKHKADPSDNDQGRGIMELLAIPAVRLAVISMFLSQVVMVTLMVITPLHMVHHAYGNQEVSWVITAHTLGMFAFSNFTGSLIGRFGPVRVMLFGGVILFAAAVISPLSTALPVLLIGLFLLGLGWNFGFIAGSTLLSDSLAGVERTRMQGTGDTLYAAAAAFGSLSSGPIYHWGGYPGVAALVGVLTLLFLYIIHLIDVTVASKPQHAKT